MIINNIKQFKDACKIIVGALDTSESTIISDSLELSADTSGLKMSVTNREYLVSVNFPLGELEPFQATVNAILFLKLISQITSDSIELNIADNFLIIKGDGTYKLPLIYNNDELLVLPTIELNNVTTEMVIKSNILNSLLIYNSREIQSAKVIYKPVQKMYYIDELGAITFTTGACVNSFNLEKPIKLLLSGKVVKLFKLFNLDSDVNFSLSQDTDSNNNVLTKVRFSTNNIEITAITPSDTQLIESVPVQAIRSMSTKTYNYSVVLDKNHLLSALSRMSLFKGSNPLEGLEIKFTKDFCTLKYCDNEEVIYYIDEQLNDIDYTLSVNIETIKTVLDGCQEDYLTINFGDNKAIVIVRQGIKNIVPELVRS